MKASPRAGACTTRSCAREGVQEKQLALALAWRWRGRTRPDWSRRLSWSAAALISEKNAAVLLLTTMSAVLLAKNENEVQSIEDNLIFNGTTRHRRDRERRPASRRARRRR